MQQLRLHGAWRAETVSDGGKKSYWDEWSASQEVTVKGEVAKKSGHQVHDEHGQDGDVGDVLHPFLGGTGGRGTEAESGEELLRVYMREANKSNARGKKLHLLKRYTNLPY